MLGRRIVVYTLGSVTALGLLAGCAAEARYDAQGRRILGTWTAGTGPHEFEAKGDVWINASCVGAGAMRVTYGTVVSSSPQQPFQCGEPAAYMLSGAENGTVKWTGFIAHQQGGDVSAWQIEVVETAATKPVGPWRPPTWFLVVPILLAAYALWVSAGYLKLAAQFSRTPLVGQDAFLAQIDRRRAFWIERPVLLLGSELLTYGLIAALFYAAVS